MNMQTISKSVDSRPKDVIESDASKADPALIDVPSFVSQKLARPFVFLPNPGNAGDALMATATYDLFDNLGLKYSSCRVDDAMIQTHLRGKTVVLSGGGNFSEGGYNNYANLLSRIHKQAGRVFVLPHTIQGNDQLLAQFGENVTLICRELVSYRHARQCVTGARVLLGHDMALLLDVKKVLADTPHHLALLLRKAASRSTGSSAARLYPPLKSILRGLRWQLLSIFKHPKKEKVAFLYRTDIEKTARPLPPGNMDASIVFNFGVTSPIMAGFTVFHLLQFLDGFETINTNRLHVAIAGALLGKQVNLSSNSYYKCRAVYDHSLKDAFPNVKWVA